MKRLNTFKNQIRKRLRSRKLNKVQKRKLKNYLEIQVLPELKEKFKVDRFIDLNKRQLEWLLDEENITPIEIIRYFYHVKNKKEKILQKVLEAEHISHYVSFLTEFENSLEIEIEDVNGYRDLRRRKENNEIIYSIIGKNNALRDEREIIMNQAKKLLKKGRKKIKERKEYLEEINRLMENWDSVKEREKKKLRNSLESLYDVKLKELKYEKIEAKTEEELIDTDLREIKEEYEKIKDLSSSVKVELSSFLSNMEDRLKELLDNINKLITIMEDMPSNIQKESGLKDQKLDSSQSQVKEIERELKNIEGLEEIKNKLLMDVSLEHIINSVVKLNKNISESKDLLTFLLNRLDKNFESLEEEIDKNNRKVKEIKSDLKIELNFENEHYDRLKNKISKYEEEEELKKKLELSDDIFNLIDEYEKVNDGLFNQFKDEYMDLFEKRISDFNLDNLVTRKRNIVNEKEKLENYKKSKEQYFNMVGQEDVENLNEIVAKDNIFEKIKKDILKRKGDVEEKLNDINTYLEIDKTKISTKISEGSIKDNSLTKEEIEIIESINETFEETKKDVEEVLIIDEEYKNNFYELNKEETELFEKPSERKDILRKYIQDSKNLVDYVLEKLSDLTNSEYMFNNTLISLMDEVSEKILDRDLKEISSICEKLQELEREYLGKLKNERQRIEKYLQDTKIDVDWDSKGEPFLEQVKAYLKYLNEVRSKLITYLEENIDEYIDNKVEGITYDDEGEKLEIPMKELAKISSDRSKLQEKITNWKEKRSCVQDSLRHIKTDNINWERVQEYLDNDEMMEKMENFSEDLLGYSEILEDIDLEEFNDEPIPIPSKLKDLEKLLKASNLKEIKSKLSFKGDEFDEIYRKGNLESRDVPKKSREGWGNEIIVLLYNILLDDFEVECDDSYPEPPLANQFKQYLKNASRMGSYKVENRYSKNLVKKRIEELDGEINERSDDDYFTINYDGESYKVEFGENEIEFIKR